jgi:hypothetical protein
VQVKEAFDILTRDRVAIKIMKRVVVRKIRGGEAAVQRELEILQLLRDERHLLRFVDAWFDDSRRRKRIW